MSRSAAFARARWPAFSARPPARVRPPARAHWKCGVATAKLARIIRSGYTETRLSARRRESKARSRACGREFGARGVWMVVDSIHRGASRRVEADCSGRLWARATPRARKAVPRQRSRLIRPADPLPAPNVPASALSGRLRRRRRSVEPSNTRARRVPVGPGRLGDRRARRGVAPPRTLVRA